MKVDASISEIMKEEITVLQHTRKYQIPEKILRNLHYHRDLYANDRLINMKLDQMISLLKKWVPWCRMT